MRDNNGYANEETGHAAGHPLDDVEATVVFDDPVAYLAGYGIEASIVAESVDRLRHAA
jgi:hypothetical protein